VRLTIRPIRLLSQPGTPAAGLAATTTEIQITAEPSATEPGTYEAAYIAREPGAYAAQAQVLRADGTPAGDAATGWTSDPAAEEFHSLKPNRALLESIARRTGGELVPLAEMDQFVRRLPSRPAPITETWSEPLWHQPMVFLFVLGCLVADWGNPPLEKDSLEGFAICDLRFAIRGASWRQAFCLAWSQRVPRGGESLLRANTAAAIESL